MMKAFKKIVIPSLAVMVMAAMIISVPTAKAAKRGEIIEKSNGFPSGPHFNLIIHGKDTEVFSCTSTSVGGNSIFVPEFTTNDLNGETEGGVSIRYIQNKKASLIDLLVLDPCAIDDGLAIVQLPDKVMLEDGSTQPTDGFWAYAKITGKPNNGDYCTEPTPDCPSKIILYPNKIVEACNDPGNEDFGTYTNCPEDGDLALGVITNNIYVPDPYTGEFMRFDPQPEGEKGARGKSKAKDITRLFIYVGWVVDARLDVDGPGGEPDGVIDEYDLPEGYFDVESWLLDLALLDPPMAWYFSEQDETWMHEIADLVITEQGLANMGTKTLQVRFYPRSTTVFH
jgi:hypothetical protein